MTKLFTILLLVPAISCLFIYRKINVTDTSKYVNVSVDIYNDGVSDSAVNFTIQTFVQLNQIMAYLRVSIPENDADMAYKQELLKTTVNVKKFLDGVAANIVTKVIMDTILRSKDFNVTFPWKKGIYRFINFSPSDALIPPNIQKAMAVVRFVGKVQGLPSSVFLIELELYSEMHKKGFNFG